MIRDKAARLLACGALLAGLAAAVPDPASAMRMEDFPLASPLTGTVRGVTVRVALTREILSRTSLPLTGIRIFDDLGRETPFIVHVPGDEHPPRVTWEIQASQAIGRDQVFLLARGMDPAPVDELMVLSDQTWACSDVQVFSGIDGQMWQPLATGRIAHLKPRLGVRSMSVSLPETHAPYLKVVIGPLKRENGVSPLGCLEPWAGATELTDPPPFTAIKGFVSRVPRTDVDGPLFDQDTVTRFDRDVDSQGNTVIDLPGVGLPIREVGFGIGQSCFCRYVTVLAGGRGKGSSYTVKASGSIALIPGLGISRITLPAFLGGAPRIRIMIMNNGGQPLALDRVFLRWPRAYLVFVPQKGRTYRICYGARDDQPAPADQASGPGSGATEVWKAGPTVLNETYRPVKTTPEDPRWLFIISGIILVIYSVGFWAIQIRNARAGK